MLISAIGPPQAFIPKGRCVGVFWGLEHQLNRNDGVLPGGLRQAALALGVVTRRRLCRGGCWMGGGAHQRTEAPGYLAGAAWLAARTSSRLLAGGLLMVRGAGRAPQRVMRAR